MTAVTAVLPDALEELAELHPAARSGMESASAAWRAAAVRALAASDFLRGALRQDPTLLLRLIEGAGASAAPLAPPASDDLQFDAAMRGWRRSEMARIAWRDLTGWAPLEETLRALSAAADTAIRSACDAATRTLNARYGVPRAADGSAQELIVLAMGKLGGGELNFSSDVDLIFLFPEHGDTDGKPSISNEEYFTRLGQLLIRHLDQRTADGFVCRVDMRLRPFGDSGPLTASFASLEDYLERHGRDWERYAWVKARAVTGESRYHELFRNTVRPFVYRRYLDFGVFESLREMKALIEREVARRDLQDNVKLGPGGIREIEFIVQAFQLVRGGQDRRLQNTSLLQTLPNLVGSKLLPAAAASELQSAYGFLRTLENRLQMIGDQQTHMLPADAATRARLALAMGCDDWSALEAALTVHRQRVMRHFAAVVADGAAPVEPLTGELGPLWESGAGHEVVAARLQGMGIAPPAAATEAAQLLLELGQSALLRRLDENGRRRLSALLPLLIADIAKQSDPVTVLRRVMRLLEAIGARSSYFALLQTNAPARARLVQLAGQSAFLIEQMAAHPLLLDELLDVRLFELLPERDAMQSDLAQRMAEVADDDEERQVEQLRHFQRAAVFRIAIADLTGRLPIMRVSDRLTDVAELIVEQAMQLTWRHLTRQLGVPSCGEGAQRRAVRICAVGYGKLGGWELGYTSDLDLVFLHDSVGEAQHTDGARTLDNQMFFVRFVQRLVHLLSMHSAAGRLYEVDMRLRPSGKGGMLITQIEAFRDYQQREAWTWEHQALLHARAVAGASELRERFEALRMELLRTCVRRDRLREDVRSMRERMRAELGQADPARFDLKKDAGGLADIEFLAQYWALQWADRYPPVAMFSDTIRQLESVASADLVPQATIDVLVDAYRRYREQIHHRSLAGQDAVVEAATLATQRAAVTSVWNATMQV